MDSIKSFPHDVRAFQHWKFQALRKAFGWSGEGRFWALNCIIAAAPRCKLDLEKQETRRMLYTELGIADKAELEKFLGFLASQECRLIRRDGEIITTDVTGESLRDAVKKARRNAKDYIRRKALVPPGAPKPPKPPKIVKEEDPALVKRFEEFWAKYPVREAKKKAMQMYVRIVNRKPELHEAILKALDDQIANRAERERRRLWVARWKNPTTWLNGECWNDELTLDNGTIHGTAGKHHQQGRVSQTGTADAEVQ